MKRGLLAVFSIIVIVIVGFQNKSAISSVYAELNPPKWDGEFQKVEIVSTLDGKKQNAYFKATTSSEPQPLIVSLHTWSGDYRQKSNALYKQAKEATWNYIHPDFRGMNKTVQACGSEYVVSDIDDAIDYALTHGNVDKSRIYVVGQSGGGYATLVSLMNLKHQINTFQAWVPISDLSAWYEESNQRGNRYAKDIMVCTGSGKDLDIGEAKKRSPLYMTQKNNLSSKVMIFAGIHDGHNGEVPISHSLKFYNKLVSERGSTDLVLENEMNHMLTKQTSPNNIHYGSIQNRKILYQKTHENLQITIFEGGHEILEDYAITILK